MPTIIPIAYNTGSSIPNTQQLGSLAIGTGAQDYGAYPGGLTWWATPDLDLHYVVAKPVSAGNQPNPLSIPCFVGYYKTPLKTEQSFIDLAEYISTENNNPQTFTGGTEANTYLNGIGYWTSYVDTYRYDSGVFLSWPSDSTGYSLYSGGFTNSDDGHSNSPITLPITFETNNQASTSLYLSTNGYFTLISGDSNILSGPTTSSPATMAANPGDNWLQPGLTNSDGDVQNWYYKTGTDGGGKYYAKLLVYAGTYGASTTPTSYIINFYRDNSFQWLETRVKSNTRGNAGPYNSIDVSQPSSTTSKVWRGDLNGQNWTYLGTGTVQV